ncbi:hypothetical protein A8990_1423 [Paenibacillus taihuensis]|uniref:Uncharacterized protein n=2 Tax=Paenibacillus taihuensis TaxID=1156355 RepID=A0A3D9QUP8_9BACL|nr:hypothetical protein A8990_1423 [Paenibacillus taihuensis]
MFAAAFGKGMFRKSADGRWTPADDGLPDGVIVNRLQVIDGSFFLCTNKGLFFHDSNSWFLTDITIPCYQVVKKSAILAAATEYGIWFKIGTQWKSVAYANKAIYDLLLTPQYYILGTSQGISLYDRYTDSAADFPLGTGVTSMAIVQSRLVGASMGGGLVLGNQRGGFIVSDFEDVTIYSLKSTETGVHACSSRGLYRIQMLESQVIMRSMLTGYPVTDLSSCGDCMYVSTLNWGLKKVVL